MRLPEPAMDGLLCAVLGGQAVGGQAVGKVTDDGFSSWWGGSQAMKTCPRCGCALLRPADELCGACCLDFLRTFGIGIRRDNGVAMPTPTAPRAAARQIQRGAGAGRNSFPKPVPAF